MQDASRQNETLLQYFSKTKTPWVIDGEIESLKSDLLFSKPALTYLRYNVCLENQYMDELELPQLKSHLKELRVLSCSNQAENLKLLGERSATRQVKGSHFPKNFDPPTVAR